MQIVTHGLPIEILPICLAICKTHSLCHVTRGSGNGLHMRENVLPITYVTTGTTLSMLLPLLGSAWPLPGATTAILNLNFLAQPRCLVFLRRR